MKKIIFLVIVLFLLVSCQSLEKTSGVLEKKVDDQKVIAKASPKQVKSSSGHTVQMVPKSDAEAKTTPPKTTKIEEKIVTSQDLFSFNLSTDKNQYRSAQNMKATFYIEAEKNLVAVKLTLSGIRGKLNQEKIVNLTSGTNQIIFNYKLPSCNICGGIKEGDYPVEGEITYQEIRENKVVTINIKQ